MALADRRSRRRSGLPSFAQVAEFVRASEGGLSAREIAHAFGLGPADHQALRGLLRAVERAGEVRRAGNRKFLAGTAASGIVPVEAGGVDADGLPLVRPIGAAEGPDWRLRGDAADELRPGERALARLVRRDSGDIEAELVRRIDPARRVVGVFRASRDGGLVIAADRRDRGEYRVGAADAAGLADGELVICEEAPDRRAGARVHILERLGPADAPGAISRSIIAAFDIPAEFPATALAEAAALRPLAAFAGRADLRDLALVTIDDSDARDFDDAVWAEPDPDPANAGGWHLVVAIADVAHYVPPGGALDQEAMRRGNSVYFPDRVVPMLPEALSNDLCSLRPGEDRPCLAAHLWIDAAGRKRRHRFERAVMRSAARLTYEAVQAAHDGAGATRLPLAAERLAALYGAFRVLEQARQDRGALDLDLPEHRVVLDMAGRPAAVEPRVRRASHRLIEEFMVLANVAAAEELEARGRACMYRVHDMPDPEKLAALRDFLAAAGIAGLALARGQVVRPALFNRILQRAARTPESAVINELVLRTQAQAVYSPNNIGHFGLALPRYAHFTSPIRRYADLVVHRALIDAAPPAPAAAAEFGAVAEHISATERRAAAAERAALERCRAAVLARAIGTAFDARIVGVARFGLFARLLDSGADGLIPVSTLTADAYDHDRIRHRLVGRRLRRVFALGEAVRVTLVEADPAGGRLIFHLADEAARPPSRRPPARRR